MQALVLGLLLAAASWAQVRIVAVPSAPVAPLIAGSLQDPASPVSKALDLELSRLEGLAGSGDLARVSARLGELAQGEPMERLAGAVLAKGLSDPEAASKLGLARSRVESLAAVLAAERGSLAAAAGSLAEADRLFDGTGAKSSLETDALWTLDSALVTGERQRPLKAPFIGAGAFGAVFGHPKVEGAIVKLVAPGFSLGETDPDLLARQDEEASRRLADADAGPRFFGTVRLPYFSNGWLGRLARRFGAKEKPAYVIAMAKEKIYGETVERLIEDRRFRAEEYALVQDLLDRMADGGVRVWDMKPGNVMIGRTLADPRVRAYHIDGGRLEAGSENHTRDELRAYLHDFPVLLKWRMDREMGVIEHIMPFDMILKEGLARSAEPSPRQRLRDWLRR